MTAKTEKAVNYTPEQTAKMIADYTAGVTVETIAVELGKTVRSVVAKLSRENVYKAKEYKTKAGETPMKKDATADEIGKLVSLSEGEIDSLTKANKTALVKVLAMLNAKRSDGVKDYPAISESKGLKGFTYSIWTGYFVKKDTPEPIMQTLNKALAEVLEDPAVKSGLDANSLLIAKPLSLNELNKVYGDGTAQFRAIAKSINLQPQ